MNVISWNVRGLGKQSKCFLVKDFLNLHHSDVCCLQESKLDGISQATWREIGGCRIDHFACVPAVGSAGGIIIGWNSSVLSGRVLSVGEFCLTIEFSYKVAPLTWICTSVYGPVARPRKLAFWEELRACVGPPSVPSIVCGDFNAIFVLSDKVTGLPNL